MVDFLKRHLVLIVSGAVGVLGIVLGALGLKGMPEVQDAMEQSQRVYSDLQSLESNPVNREVIEAERERIEKVLSDLDACLARLKEDYRYVPLVKDALPNGEYAARNEFRRAYARAMGQLMDSLQAGTVPTQDQFALVRETVKQEQSGSGGLPPSAVALDELPPGPAYSPAGVLLRTVAGAATDIEARTYMGLAQQINLYAIDFRRVDRPDQDHPPALQFASTMVETGNPEPPAAYDIWWAQMQYWIQRDVVEAINALNQEASGTVEGVPWVGVLPVKELISIRVGDSFLLGDGGDVYGSPPGGTREALPMGSSMHAFTGTVSTKLYDVMQFSVKLVIDQRDLNRFVEKLYAQGLHTLLRVGYETVPPVRTMRGKIYGSEPVVNVVLDFETILLGDVFRPLMPDELLEEYGLERPEPPAEEGETGEDGAGGPGEVEPADEGGADVEP